jgi:hypothetical protein
MRCWTGIWTASPRPHSFSYDFLAITPRERLLSFEAGEVAMLSAKTTALAIVLAFAIAASPQHDQAARRFKAINAAVTRCWPSNG